MDDRWLDDFDTNWFIGCLRSIDQISYNEVINVMKLQRLDNQNKSVRQIKPNISKTVLDLFLQEEQILFPAKGKKLMKRKISALNGLSRVEKKKIQLK